MKKLLLVLAATAASMTFANKAQAQTDYYVYLPSGFYFPNDDPVEVLWATSGVITEIAYEFQGIDALTAFKDACFAPGTPNESLKYAIKILGHIAGPQNGYIGLQIIPYIPGYSGIQANIHFMNLLNGQTKTIKNYQ